MCPAKVFAHFLPLEAAIRSSLRSSDSTSVGGEDMKQGGVAKEGGARWRGSLGRGEKIFNVLPAMFAIVSWTEGYQGSIKEKGENLLEERKEKKTTRRWGFDVSSFTSLFRKENHKGGKRKEADGGIITAQMEHHRRRGKNTTSTGIIKRIGKTLPHHTVGPWPRRFGGAWREKARKFGQNGDRHNPSTGPGNIERG